MNPTPSFTSFRIEGLRGGPDINVSLKNNTLIIVGENGSGKTTLLRIIFYFLSGRWHSLAQYEFKKITAVIENHEYVVKHRDIAASLSIMHEGNLARIPPAQRRRVAELLDSGRIEEAEYMLNHVSARYGLSARQRELALGKHDKALQAISEMQDRITKRLGAQILYLPTYRRIERELSSILQGVDPEESRRTQPVRQQEDGNDYVELVEFGMKDVKKAINETLEGIRNFQLQGTTRLSLSYLGDVVSQSYLSTDSSAIANTSEETIEAVLNRIDDTILSENHKSHLRDILVSSKINSNLPSEHERIIYHYFAKLIGFQDELQEKEASLKLFCGLCSDYITDKRFVYESGRAVFRIEASHSKVPIELSDLSSGEKQIVSLFSHLYLSGKHRFFVLIDEPELSLSVPWQRRFLIDIAKASFCSGLIAVTHSPFIYDNELRPNTHALGEFIDGPDWGNIK